MSFNYQPGEITNFPVFTKLSLGHREAINKIVSRFEPYSDFTFVNLFTWSGNDATEASLLNGNLVVRLPDYFTGENTMYSLIGERKLDETIAELLVLADRLSIVPDVVVRNIQRPENFLIVEDRDSNDYMYDANLIANMPGDAFKKKRNKKNSFIKDFGSSISVEHRERLEKSSADEIESVFMGWETVNNKTLKECETERAALRRMLDNFGSLGVVVTIVRISGKICAFSINEIRGQDVICHLEKALPVHSGLYSFVISNAAQYLVSCGVDRLNWQQDLGIIGLRQAKERYHPLGFLKKYTISKHN